MTYYVIMPENLAERLRSAKKPIISSDDPCVIGDIAISKDRKQVYKVIAESTLEEFLDCDGILTEEEKAQQLFFYEVLALD